MASDAPSTRGTLVSYLTRSDTSDGPAPDVELSSGADRYEDRGLLGEGGQGEVRRMYDTLLDREVAMKRLHAELGASGRARLRFALEIEATAALQHPGIVPIYDAGQLGDGRLYFTMPVLRGSSLDERIRDAHGAPAWLPALHGLVGLFQRACEAVGYAHASGVVHRDLKPSNLMIGEHGELYVVDWGLVRLIDADDDPPVGDSPYTRVGTISGTPSYMAPEQARAENDALDARTDVHALGAVLHRILTGHTPHVGSTQDVLNALIEGKPPLLRTTEPGPWEHTIPAGLRAICLRALAHDPEDRFADASQLGEAVADWLTGAERRSTAEGWLARAESLGHEVEATAHRGRGMVDEAIRALEEVPPWAPVPEKAPHWARRREGEHLIARAEALDAEAEALLRQAVAHAPDLHRATELLLDRAIERHRVAETSHDAGGEARWRAVAERLVSALPTEHPSRARGDRYLEGTGAVSLVTDPPGASVRAHRYELVQEALVEGEPVDLGVTPLDSVPLARGSYLLVVEAEGHESVRYPVHIPRNHHADGVPPDGDAPRPIALPPAGSLGPDDVYVPAGWFLEGGDDLAETVRTGPAWVDGFVIRRFPVTNAEYLVFLNDLVAGGRADEARERVPRANSHLSADETTGMGLDASGRYVFTPDGQGDLWGPDWPVFLVSFHDASAYAAWYAERTGVPWRLPTSPEWGKAARGVDGRHYPWGDVFDSTRANTAASNDGRAYPCDVDTYPIDCSPYGVRGVAGNMIDWVDGIFVRPVGSEHSGRVVTPEGMRGRRGGYWCGSPRHSRLAMIQGARAALRQPISSFRLAYTPDL